MIMVDETYLSWPGFPSDCDHLIVLRTGEVVHNLPRLVVTWCVDGRWVRPNDDQFYKPLKPGDHYITEFSNLTIRFNVTEEILADQRGPNYFFYKDMEKLGLVSIHPAIKLEPQ